VLRVLEVIPTLDRSGAEKQMVLLAQGLPRDRFEVEVAALTRLGPLAAPLRAAGIPIHAIGKRFKLDPIALGKLTRLMRRRRYDVVHTWIFAANTYGRAAARWANVPVVVVSEMAVDLWKGKVERAVDRKLAGWCDRVIGNSRAVVDYYRALGVPEDRLMCIPSGIGAEDPPAEDRERLRHDFGVEPGDVVLLFAGRLAAQKCVEDLIDAVDLLQHVMPRLRTWIVGDGPLRERLEERARAFELIATDRLRFWGHRDDVPRLMWASDIVVLPSRYEGLPNVVLEGMRMSKPVVATAAPGTTEVVRDGETGLLVPIGKPVELARAIRQVAEDPELAARLGSAGRRRVEEEFRLDEMIARYATLFEELAGRKRGASAGPDSAAGA
jgi:glycosyltransferase involved in cell wall biosynthesis